PLAVAGRNRLRRAHAGPGHVDNTGCRARGWRHLDIRRVARQPLRPYFHVLISSSKLRDSAPRSTRLLRSSASPRLFRNAGVVESISTARASGPGASRYLPGPPSTLAGLFFDTTHGSSRRFPGLWP